MFAVRTSFVNVIFVKMQGNVFLMNQRPHAKIQLIWKEKKHPKRHLTFGYTKPFIIYFIFLKYAKYTSSNMFWIVLLNKNLRTF